MKWFPGGCVAALALAFCAAVAPGCAEDNEASVTSGQGSVKPDLGDAPAAGSQQELIERYQKRGNTLADEGYPGASRNLGPGGAASNEAPKGPGGDAAKEAVK